jgi:hypothetical protein
VFDRFGDWSNLPLDDPSPITLCPVSEQQLSHVHSFPDSAGLVDQPSLCGPGHLNSEAVHPWGCNSLDHRTIQSSQCNSTYILPRPRRPSHAGTPSDGVQESSTGRAAVACLHPSLEGRDDYSEYNKHERYFVDPSGLRGEQRGDIYAMSHAAAQPVQNTFDSWSFAAGNTTGPWTATASLDDDDLSLPSPEALVSIDRKFQRWTEEEDDILRDAFRMQCGPTMHWKTIARQCFGNRRSASQCKSRWTKVCQFLYLLYKLFRTERALYIFAFSIVNLLLELTLLL